MSGFFATLKRKRTASCESRPCCRLGSTLGKRRKESFGGETPETSSNSQSLSPTSEIQKSAPADSNGDDRQEQSTQSAPLDYPDSSAKENDVAPTSSPVRFPARVHDQIEHQINLEILLKHNELRLIEQELAKCQVALEQLRRCQIIPYPGQTAANTDPDLITTGTGLPLLPAHGFSRPSHPPPFGVTDGPYTQHYAAWLLPSPEFDSHPAEPARHASTRSATLGVETRQSRGERGSHSAARAQRGSASQLYALASNYPTPRERSGPLTIMRVSDGQRVKLVCQHCQKENIDSVQGFLNHCRIAHSRTYKTHQEAADECGQLLDPSEIGDALAFDSREQALGSSHLKTPTRRASNLPSGHANDLHRPLVHPLIVSATAQVKSADSSSGPPIVMSNPFDSAGLDTSARWVPKTLPSQAKTRESSDRPVVSSFVPCPQTPHLSSLLQKRGVDGDFAKLVAATKERLDLEQVITLVPEESEEPSSDVKPVGPIAGKTSTSALSRSTSGAGTVVIDQTRDGCFPTRKVRPPRTKLEIPPHCLFTPSPLSGNVIRGTAIMDSPEVEQLLSNSERLEVPETPPEHADMDYSPQPGLMSIHGDEDDGSFTSPCSLDTQQARTANLVDVRRYSDALGNIDARFDDDDRAHKQPDFGSASAICSSSGIGMLTDAITTPGSSRKPKRTKKNGGKLADGSLNPDWSW